MKKFLIILGILTLCSLEFTSCESKVEYKNAIVGKWQCDSLEVYTLTANGYEDRAVTKYNAYFTIEFFSNGKRAAGEEIEGEWYVEEDILHVSFYDAALPNQEYFIEELNNMKLRIRYKGIADYPRHVYYYSRLK